jgi:hypothetical protein
MNNRINRNIHRDLINWQENGGTCFEIRTEPKEEKLSWFKRLLKLCKRITK